MSLNAFDREAANGLNEQFWSAWGPELQRPSGVGHLDCGMEQEQGTRQNYSRAVITRRQSPLGWGSALKGHL